MHVAVVVILPQHGRPLSLYFITVHRLLSESMHSLQTVSLDEGCKKVVNSQLP